MTKWPENEQRKKKTVAWPSSGQKKERSSTPWPESSGEPGLADKVAEGIRITFKWENVAWPESEGLTMKERVQQVSSFLGNVGSGIAGAVSSLRGRIAEARESSADDRESVQAEEQPKEDIGEDQKSPQEENNPSPEIEEGWRVLKGETVDDQALPPGRTRCLPSAENRSLPDLREGEEND
jgi:hypothetical protein